MTLVGRKGGKGEAKLIAQCRRQLLEVVGVGADERRAEEIEALPIVEWKGRELRAVRCNGTTGKGPHVVNVPAMVLWSVIDLRAFRCPYHA